LAEIPNLPGVLAYGATSSEAITKVQELGLCALADRYEPSLFGAPYPCIGFLVGLVVAAALWFLPIPVVLVVWAFDLKREFVKYMWLSMPFYMLIPLIGMTVGWLIARRAGARFESARKPSGDRSQADKPG
jgi:hypothetical protein